MNRSLPSIRALTLACAALAVPLALNAEPPAAPVQPQDEEYARLIQQHLIDKRFTTELVDHMPLSDTVPSPLKFFGRIPGTPDELTYAKDIQRYYEELARTSPRVKFMKLGTTEEGRDQIVIAIADEATLAKLDQVKADLAALGDPRRTNEAQARQIIANGKPIYWVTSGIHSPETGGPEMLIELAYRLAVEETPFIQNIRNNMVTFITPVVEVDGREKQVDTYYYGKKTGKARPPLVYWGKYVAHDNNRDGMGQFLKLTQNITRGVLEWHPTVLHDLHEAQSYLYTSTGTGPYNPSLDPIQSNEWWLLAETEVMEMTKRGVPGVWTYGFYDGWVPNYLFWIAQTHNSFGRFYEVQSYGPDIQKGLKLGPTVTSREWYRPNPPLPEIDWAPRNNTNIQESALLFALHRVATDHSLYLENYWVKSKNAITAGQTGKINAWVIPAQQVASLNVIDMVNELRHQGVEISTANQAFTAGGVQVAAGDYIIRGDQPYRTLADMYLSVQNYPASNPRPYDDTGWTMQFMRNVDLKTVSDPAILQQPMTLLAADVTPPGTITGTGSTILLNHTGENELVSLRFKLKGAKMLAAEAPFELGGKNYAAGTFILPNADRASVERVVRELGLRGEAVTGMPSVPTHALTAPRIGYMHSWLRTQDEGWWRAALDTYGIPYTYFADIKARAGGLRAKYDIIIYPTVGTSAREQVIGVAMNGSDPIPYKNSALTPNLGKLDSADDIRGGLGQDGLAELKKFVEQGGTLIGDGSTVEMLAEYGVAEGVSVSKPSELFTKGAIMRGVFTDKASPLAYGYQGKELPIYFSEAPVLTISQGGRGMGYFDPSGPGVRLSQNTTPNAGSAPLSTWGAQPAPAEKPAGTDTTSPFGSQLPVSRRGGADPTQFPRVVMQFPDKGDDILLSGMLSGSQALTRKALIVDVPDGKGHMVLYALRPFWRWQTQGSYFLGFNAILNWDHLDAGAPAKPRP
ncbi:M14 family zinc carboxypeptidase [Novosphingobium album (ex Liu et al. 2023)]|uniref:M14 family zinc carboxypeptidase n=1 Tax=Novosphingobium album (ex Liu et al. 2023) TaxID=3031130 RepID=A0ABT5WMB7_9SPHN|nr:M14 family zinc carboxypeptidase [Novosphingobium album (ex Liu et al. 2023)]MDE8651188.1 M14 family zinc carboxypeptidase [Novosphingobium album (ex Liu et al. 2023)]